MRVLDTGKEVLDDYDVLRYIRDKRKQHTDAKAKTKAEGGVVTERPYNFLESLQSVSGVHIQSPTRAPAKSQN